MAELAKKIYNEKNGLTTRFTEAITSRKFPSRRTIENRWDDGT